jgi:activator of HSP90 ATPase
MMSDEANPNEIVNGFTRRQAITGVAMAFGGLTLNPTEAWAEVEQEISRTAESIHQEISFNASPSRVYEVLIETKQFDKVIELAGGHSAALGTEPTNISNQLGGAFTLFGGHIIGRQIELIPNERIVQAWRVVDWAPGIYSIANFELKEQSSGTRIGTRIVFDHTGFPKGLGEHLAAGWKGHYWEPLEKFLS